MRKLNIKVLFVSLLVSMASVSYSEKFQMDLFMPFRDLIIVPEKIILEKKVSKYGIPYKTSKNGFYINPYTTASDKKNIVRKILKDNSCKNVLPSEKVSIFSRVEYYKDFGRRSVYNGENFTVWEYPISFTYGLKPGWISALAQSAISELLLAASICESNILKKEILLTLSKEAINSMLVPVNAGGVLIDLKDKKFWYSEYSQKDIVAPMVLNGHNYALISLYHLKNHFPETEAMFQMGVSALKNEIIHYDLGIWSYYDQAGSPANLKYQRIHVSQMNELFKITRDDFFYKYYKKFKLQLFSPISSLQRFFIKPSRFLGGLLILNCLFFYIIFIFIINIKKRTI